MRFCFSACFDLSQFSDRYIRLLLAIRALKFAATQGALKPKKMDLHRHIHHRIATQAYGKCVNKIDIIALKHS